MPSRECRHGPLYNSVGTIDGGRAQQGAVPNKARRTGQSVSAYVTETTLACVHAHAQYLSLQTTERLLEGMFACAIEILFSRFG